MNYIVNKILTDLEANVDKHLVKYFYFGSPYELSEQALGDGVITLTPVNNSITSASTGVQDLETFQLELVVAKMVKNDFYNNAQKESGIAVVTKIMEGRDATNNSLLTNTVRYVLRSNFRNYGVRMPSIDITYDDDKYANLGCATATAVITIENIFLQSIN